MESGVDNRSSSMFRQMPLDRQGGGAFHNPTTRCQPALLCAFVSGSEKDHSSDHLKHLNVFVPIQGCG